MKIAQVNLNGSFAVVQKQGDGAWRTIDNVRDMADVMSLNAASLLAAYDRGQVVNPQPGDFLPSDATMLNMLRNSAWHRPLAH